MIPGIVAFRRRAAVPVPWTPAMLPNAKAWYVADNPNNTVVGGLTTALSDKGGGGFTATAVNAGAAMTDALNGRAVLRTSAGAGIFMSEAAGNAIARSAGGVSIFAVHRQISRDGAGYPAVGSASFGAGSGTLQCALMREQDGHQPGSINMRTRPNSGAGGVEVADETNYGTAWIVAGGSRRFNHNDGFIYVNGAQTAFNGSMNADAMTQDTGMSLMVGSYNSWGLDNWSVNIAEIVYVRDDIAEDDRLRLDGYLAWEWGRQDSLIAGHPYKLARPMTIVVVPEPEPPVPKAWTEIAQENQPFTLTAPGKVRFGADSRWFEQDLPAGSYTCNADRFGGDPAEMTFKVCQLYQ